MVTNCRGAMCGGLIEYNRMYFGFATLYLFVLVLYAAASVMGLVF